MAPFQLGALRQYLASSVLSASASSIPSPLMRVRSTGRVAPADASSKRACSAATATSLSAGSSAVCDVRGKSAAGASGNIHEAWVPSPVSIPCVLARGAADPAGPAPASSPQSPEPSESPDGAETATSAATRSRRSRGNSAVPTTSLTAAAHPG